MSQIENKQASLQNFFFFFFLKKKKSNIPLQHIIVLQSLDLLFSYGGKSQKLQIEPH
jgi:hypothetical protein